MNQKPTAIAGNARSATRRLDAPGHIALIGNSLPRRCGLATFTSDCHDALKKRFPEMRIDYYAMDDGADGIAYPPGIHTIAQNDPIAYSAAARDIEASGAEAIWLQHEFGIFGGPAGGHVLRLLERTTVPVLTMLHTVLETFEPEQERVFRAVVERSSQVVVMAKKAREILLERYGVDNAKVNIIPHGVPDRPYVEPDSMKAAFGLEGRKALLTFGLLAPDKGIDHMIRAMPAIVERHPDASYIVLGATHPNLVRQEGDKLRESLVALAEELGVADNVRFIDRFVDLPELLDRLQATDIYVTPYMNPLQVTSGTLSYAVAMGKPVVSTPYIHATEILADDHGVLVPFSDSNALAEAVGGLLDDDVARSRHAALAYERGRGMIWNECARKAGGLLARARDSRIAQFPIRHDFALLAPDISAVARMSDGTGMMQHGIFSVPDRNHGYCLDDNARALLLMSQAEDINPVIRDRWTATYAAFVQHAWNPDAGRFRNFMRYDRSWCEEIGSEDSFGRAVWALGVTARDATQQQYRDWAGHLLDQCLPHAGELGSPRARAFVMLGCAALIEVRGNKVPLARELLEQSGFQLLALLHEARRPDWAWFEAMLAYDNARLPEALLRAGAILQDRAFIECGLATLDWIVTQQTAPDGHFRAVGSESFGRTYAQPLPFDQQPLEAQGTIEACEAALAVDPALRWHDRAEAAYRWFLGQNDLDQPLATVQDGGCFDGLMPHGVNRNQGAESILALQLASCAMKRVMQTPKIVAQRNQSANQAVPA
jgi:glycosyltransferase involved in cell wall biosynthesis